MAEAIASKSSSRLHQSKAQSITALLKQGHDVWVKNNLPKSRGVAGNILINMKEPEGEAFVVEIGSGKATNLSVQASDKAMNTSTELRRLLNQNDLVILDKDAIEALSDREIHVPGEYLDNPNVARIPDPEPNLNDIHPRLIGMAREFELLLDAVGGEDADPTSIADIQVDRMMDEIMALADLLRMDDFNYIKANFTHPDITKYVDAYLSKNKPRA